MKNTILAYHEVLNNLYEGLYIVDINRQITFWNRSAEKISGFSSKEIAVTVSIGASAACENENETDAIKRADEGLYASKHAGRNCITWIDKIE